MCSCVYCRQEPDYPREQHEQATKQANEDVTTARYQIERAIAQLETSVYDGRDYKLVTRSVIAQLKAYLAE